MTESHHDPIARRVRVAMVARRMRRLALAGLMVLAGSVGASAEAPAIVPYLDGSTVDLSMLLPPPPASDSAETKSELGELLVLQITRTPDMVAHAQADAIEEVWRFADVLGPKFNAEALPKTAALFDRLVATDNAVLEPAKSLFNRQRPYVVSDLIRPVVKLATSGSFPSSHASLGTLMGIVLAKMLPEKRAILMQRAWTYAENRMVAGAHFPSDVEMGRISGTVIAEQVFQQPGFRTEFEAARVELRAALQPE